MFQLRGKLENHAWVFGCESHKFGSRAARAGIIVVFPCHLATLNERREEVVKKNKGTANLDHAKGMRESVLLV